MLSSVLKKYKPLSNVKCFFVAVKNISKKKKLLSCSYILHENNKINHLHLLRKGHEIYLKYYDNVLILGDLKTDISEICFNAFCKLNNLKNYAKSLIF